MAHAAAAIVNNVHSTAASSGVAAIAAIARRVHSVCAARLIGHALLSPNPVAVPREPTMCCTQRTMAVVQNTTFRSSETSGQPPSTRGWCGPFLFASVACWSFHTHTYF
eukprot:5375063-Pleurochrysis_carterae.AAC.1